MWIAGLMVVVGPLVLVLAGREVRIQRRLRIHGTRTSGTVVRHVRRADSEGGVSYFPVVAYRDDAGSEREYRSANSGSRRTWPIGRQVPVIYLPGEPRLARIDLRSQRAAAVGVMVIVGGSFTAVGAWLLAAHR